MDKLCIDVFIPGLNKSYDIMLEPEMKVNVAADYIFKTVSEYEMLSLNSNSFILCKKSSKKILDGNLTLKQCDVRDGSKLILI